MLWSVPGKPCNGCVEQVPPSMCQCEVSLLAQNQVDNLTVLGRDVEEGVRMK